MDNLGFRRRTLPGHHFVVWLQAGLWAACGSGMAGSANREWFGAASQRSNRPSNTASLWWSGVFLR